MHTNVVTYDRTHGVTKTMDRCRQAGFTLVELLVVLIILGLIAAFAAPQVIKYVGQSKTKAASIQIDSLGSAIDLYRLEEGRYPSEDEGLEVLVGGTIKKADALIDPWGRPDLYRFPGEHGDFDLYTLGADDQEGGEGENRDLTSW